LGDSLAAPAKGSSGSNLPLYALRVAWAIAGAVGVYAVGWLSVLLWTSAALGAGLLLILLAAGVLMASGRIAGPRALWSAALWFVLIGPVWLLVVQIVFGSDAEAASSTVAGVPGLISGIAVAVASGLLAVVAREVMVRRRARAT
jgi:hypothetical protein